MIRALLAGTAVLGALGALSVLVVNADREAARAETVRLALWRLDAQASALLLAEAARPLDDWRRRTPLPDAPVWLRAVERDGTVTSPSSADAEGARRLAALRDRLVTPQVAGAVAMDDGEREEKQAFPQSAQGGPGRDQPQQDRQASQVIAEAVVQEVERKAAAKGTSSLDYGSRARNAQVQNAYLAPAAAGLLTCRWLGADLVLERPLTDGSAALTVVAWPAWERQLAAGIADVLPGSSLRPATADDTVRLASIPAALEPGAPAATALAPATRWTLIGAWLAGLGGLAAVLWAMAAAALLAERRAAFVSAVTHELRTPLTALRLHGDLLADARIADDPARRAAPVAAVRDGALRLAHLIDNVLDYARLERRRPPAPRPVPLDALLPAVEARLPGAVIAPVPAATVRCDPQAVERILANLADNAAKYGKAPYELAVRPIGRRIEIALTDHGPGLAPDARTRLFTPFARSAEAAAGDAPGVGLGLALCRRLARAQGGDLRLEDVPGGGVRAVLVLRLA